MELRARDHNAPTAWLGPSLQKAADAHCRDPGKQMTFVERPFCSSFVQGRPGLILPTPGVSRRPHPHPSAGARNGHSTTSCCHIPSPLPLRPLSLQWRHSRDPARRVETQETGSCDRQGWYRRGGQAPKCSSVARAVVPALARPPEPQPRPVPHPSTCCPDPLLPR